jgi:hypothetical protein
LANQQASEQRSYLPYILLLLGGGGTLSIKATYQRVKRLFYWPQLRKDIEEFIATCPNCQRAKSEHCHYLGLLAPLPIPDLAWNFISMDSIEGLPKSGNKSVILVVVNRLTKYSHFIALSHPYIAHSVAQAFIDNVFKLHGPPVAIVTDRYKIFTSKLWQDIFKSMKVFLHFSYAYHPKRTAKQRVNQCVENYLRCMTFQEPTKWAAWLPLA